MLLDSFWQQLQPLLRAAKGIIAFTAPKQPLALTALLDTLRPGSTMSLSSCQHPVIQVIVVPTRWMHKPEQTLSGLWWKVLPCHTKFRSVTCMLFAY